MTSSWTRNLFYLVTVPMLVFLLGWYPTIANPRDDVLERFSRAIGAPCCDENIINDAIESYYSLWCDDDRSGIPFCAALREALFNASMDICPESSRQGESICEPENIKDLRRSMAQHKRIENLIFETEEVLGDVTGIVRDPSTTLVEIMEVLASNPCSVPTERYDFDKIELYEGFLELLLEVAQLERENLS